MKRSEINGCMKKALGFAEKFNVNLPPFARWTKEDWLGKGHEADEIRDLMLGWDITDFQCGDFSTIGRTLFTMRNGSDGSKKYKRIYSEKMIFIEENQAAPIHYHHKKTEDIINRAGGNVLVRVSKATPDGQKSDESFEMSINGCRKTCVRDEIIRLGPGESVLMPAGTIHEFWSEEGTGMTITGEVASVCDEINDNAFLVECGRFAKVEEDEPMLYPLCNEYLPAQ